MKWTVILQQHSVSTIITIVLKTLFIDIVTRNAMIQGFGDEEIVELKRIFPLYRGSFSSIGSFP